MSKNKPNLKLCSNHFPPRQTQHWLCVHNTDRGMVVSSAPSPGRIVATSDGKTKYRMTTQGNLVRLDNGR